MSAHRYVVLDTVMAQFKYYRRRGDATEAGAVPLREVLAVDAGDAEPGAPTPHGVRVRMPGRDYEFYATTAEDSANWIHALEAARAAARVEVGDVKAGARPATWAHPRRRASNVSRPSDPVATAATGVLEKLKETRDGRAACIMGNAPRSATSFFAETPALELPFFRHLAAVLYSGDARARARVPSSGDSFRAAGASTPSWARDGPERQLAERLAATDRAESLPAGPHFATYFKKTPTLQKFAGTVPARPRSSTRRPRRRRTPAATAKSWSRRRGRKRGARGRAASAAS